MILQITALTNAKDHERLALLKEVAGTKVYEQRRTESLRIMAETDAKRTKINELIDYIDSRLTELEEEKEELREFQDKDKERRCLEYALYQRELEEVGEALEEIDEERRGEVHGANMRREQFDTREKEIQVCPTLPLTGSIIDTAIAPRATNLASETFPPISPNITERCTLRAQ
jgi:structural maintenance of chromosome 3 (chondroitin sulfate proteoglycan 6)